MSNTRSTQLRPVVSLLALLVVAFMVIAAPASAGWKPHRAPQFKRAVIAVHATDAQAIAAQHQLAGVQRRLRTAQRRLVLLTSQERAVRQSLVTASAVGIGDAATAFLQVARDHVALKRSIAALHDDLTFTRTLQRKARQRRAVVLAGLSLDMRQHVLRADRARQLKARARRGAVHRGALLAPVLLQAPAAAGDIGTDLAVQLAGTSAVPAASGPGAIAAAYALTQLGVRYTPAGYSPTTGFDCSGLVYWAFAQAGRAIPRSSWQIWDAGRRVSRAAAEPGDIVSFHGQGHVGIYLGDGLYVHSTKSGDVVRVHALADRHDIDGFVRLG